MKLLKYIFRKKLTVFFLASFLFQACSGKSFKILTDDFNGAPKPKVSLAVNPTVIREDGTATVEARLDRTATSAVSVSLSFAGTATKDSDYTVSATSINIPAGSNKASITLSGKVDGLTSEGNETVEVSIASVSGADLSDTTSVTLTITDLPGPVITNASLESNNTYIDITWSEGIYGDSGASTAISASDLVLTFNQNGGNATAVSISSVKQNDSAVEASASALAGGETIIRVFLSITGTPSGVETIAIGPASATSIYNSSGDAASTLVSTGNITLNDKLAPNPPAGLDLADADDTGASNTDNVTKNTTALTISGTAEAGSTVALSSDKDGSLGSTTADGAGNWSLDVSLTENVHSITATATDAASNTSAPSAPLSITVDTTIPAVPAAPDLAAADDSGSSNTDNITNVTTNLTFSGTAEPYATVGLYVDGTPQTPSVQADAAGNWTKDINLAEGGPYSITITQTDLAGNLQTTPSSALSVTVDTTAPAAPTGLDLAAADDLGISNTDNVTSQTSALTISGSAEANSTITFTSDLDGTVGSGSANGSGTFSIDINLTSAGTHSITATATDAAGNVSAASTPLSITIDTTAPTIVSAETLDTNNNGKIDHYKLTFSKNVNDATFPGYVANSQGTATTDWLIAGYSNVRLAHGTAAPQADTANDTVLYLAFDENTSACTAADQSGCDTGAKPDLTTSATPGLQDTSGNTIAQVSTVTVTEADTAQPIVVDIKSAANDKVDVVFSEDVEQTSAETTSNYSITGGSGLTISAAARDAINNYIVRLTTSAQSQITYTGTVSNVKDLANLTVNTAANSDTFTGIIKPSVVSAVATAYNKVEVTFSETVTAASAECINTTACSTIYSASPLTITNGVSKAGAGVDNTVFVLTIASPGMTEGQNYTLTVTAGTVTSASTGETMGSTGNTANFVGDGIPQVTLDATGCSGAANNQVIFTYDQAMMTGSVTAADNVDEPTNYKVTACSGGICAGSPQTASAVSWNGATKEATVTFASAMSADGSSLYTFEVSNVKDTNGNMIVTPTTKTANCGTDLTPPTFDLAALSNQTSSQTEVMLTFSEPVDQTTAETVSNYKYDSQAFGTNIISATRQTSTNKVLLVIQPALAAGGHSITVQNIKDLNNNTIVGTPQQPFTINPPQTLTEGPVFPDPFGDGLPAGQVFVYDGKMFIGPNSANSSIFEMAPDASSSQTISLDGDGTPGAPVQDFSATGYKSQYSCSAGTGCNSALDGIDIFYAACVGSSDSTLTGSSCTSAGGTEMLFIGARNTTGFYRSFWSTTDTSAGGTTFTFTEDGDGFSAGGVTFRSTGMIVYKEQLYFVSAAEGGGGGRMTRICIQPGGCQDAKTPTVGSYLNLNTQVLRRFGQKGNGNGVDLENGTQQSGKSELVGASTLYEHDTDGSGPDPSQLYIANGGSYTDPLGTAPLGNPRAGMSDGGILRTKIAYSYANQHPINCTGTANCDTYWEDVTPDSNTKWNTYVSIPYPANSAVTGAANCNTSTKEWDCLVPYNRITPAMKAIPYMRTAPNGDLYMIRNACSVMTVCHNGDADTPPTSCDFRTHKQVCPKGYEIPQLWMLPKGSGSTSWQLVAEAGSTGRTDMSGNTGSCGTSPNKCLSNTHITLLEFNGSFLYIGFDNATYGANLWRVDFNNATSYGGPIPSGSVPAESDFSLVGNFGLDTSGSTNSRIFWHATIDDAGTPYLWVVARDGTGALNVYRTNNN